MVAYSSIWMRSPPVAMLDVRLTLLVEMSPCHVAVSSPGLLDRVSE